MSETDNNIIEKDVSALFGFEDLSDEEKAALLDEIGSVILESATLRLMVESKEDVAAHFEKIVEEHADSEKMLAELIETFPRFEALLREEVTAFKQEATDVLAE